MQVAIGDAAVGAGGIAFPQDGDLIGAGFQMPVDAVGRDVQLSVGEPVDAEIRLVETGVLHAGEGRDPVQTPGLFAPIAVRIGLGGVIGLGVAFRIHGRAIGPFGNGVNMGAHACLSLSLSDL